MKTYKITIAGKEIDVVQNEDGSFNKPNMVKELESYGTALKPAFEPICMAMKPLSEKNYVANILKYGTGGINIDESRVETSDKYSYPNGAGGNSFSVGDEPNGKRTEPVESNSLGRFPANLIHDNSEEVRECFPEANHKTGSSKGAGFQDSFVGGKADGGIELPRYNDSGNASRFFKSIIYQAKASKSERNRGCEGLPLQEKVFNGQSDTPSVDMKDVEKRFTTQPKQNNHPTVKPVALMEYLIKMVTPKGGIVLDPFAGSGSTLVAAKQNDYQYIGIEKEEEYIKIIEARLKI